MQKEVVISGGSDEGFFQGIYTYKNEWGNSSPSELSMYIEQLGEVVSSGQKVNIKFYGDLEHSGFVDFCKKVSDKFSRKEEISLPVLVAFFHSGFQDGRDGKEFDHHKIEQMYENLKKLNKGEIISDNEF